MKYKTNIRELFEEFDNFLPGAVIGIAREMQPVYRYIMAVGVTARPSTQSQASIPSPVLDTQERAVLIAVVLSVIWWGAKVGHVAILAGRL